MAMFGKMVGRVLGRTLRIGNPEKGTFFEILNNGLWRSHGEAVQWDEISQSMVGRNIFVNPGRIDYDYTELVLEYTDTARYPQEFAGSVSQTIHSRKEDSDIRPHIHWIQTSDNTPNILVEYRWQNNGEVASAWELKALTGIDNIFDFTESGMEQITAFNLPEGHGVGKNLSATFEVKIYRDSQNASGLFSGVDSYTGAWALKYYDIHLQKDTNGSFAEFVKY